MKHFLLKKNLPAFLPTLFLGMFLMPNFLGAQVSGTVFRDLDNDGTLDATELREAGIRVVAYNAAGDSVTQVITTSAAGDNYSFTGLTLPVRLEFRTANYLYASKGAVANTTVQFHSAASSAADLAVQYPILYCQSNPDVIIPCYVAGNPEGGGTGGSLDALIRFAYTNAGSTPGPTAIASASQIGTVWGSAYQRESKKLILATFLKRHCGLEASGLGGLFLGDMTTPPGTIASYIDVEDFGITLGSAALAGRTLPASATTSSTDPLAFDNVGKIGMGSIDLSDDGTVLWAVNLFTKEIFSFQIGNPVKAAGSVTAGDFESFAIPNPGCTNGVARPWAIEYYEGKVYVGVICSGESAGGTQSNLFAYVYKFDPATETWDGTPVISFALNYPKGDVHTSYPAVDEWETWTGVFTDLHFNGTAGSPSATRTMRPQPILSDIQFDKRGNLVLGFCDRAGHQLGRNQVSTTGGATLYNGYIGGDILYCKSNGAGGFTLESNATFTGGPTGSGAGNNEGPGNGEFFANDFYSTLHVETMQGGLFYHPSRDEIMANQMDPLTIFSGGVVRHDVSDGSSDAATMRYEIYNSTPADGTFGKANGLGLLDMACDALPLEIGNRVWSDTDRDGVQDAGETGISGLTVDLYKAGVKVGTTTTNGNGNYYFTAANVNLNGATGLLYNMAYEIRVPTAQAPLTLLEITLPNVNSDLTDNDATVVGADAVIPYTTRYSGENSHTLDMGFKVTCTPITLGPVPMPDGTVGTPYSVQVTATGGTSPYTFIMYDGLGGTIPPGLTMNSSGLVTGTPTTPGAFSVKITVLDANMCPDTLDPAAITILSNCTLPTAITFTQTAATCTGATANNDGSITLTAATNGTHFGISTLNAAVYDGAAFATATAISLPQLVQTSIPNTGGTYIVRIFNGANDCFKDTTIAVLANNCFVGCPGNLVDFPNFETGTFPAPPTAFGFAGGAASDFTDAAPDGWTQAVVLGENYWVESSAAHSGNKYVYMFSAGTTSGGNDACSQISVSGLQGGTCYKLCVYAADAKADGDASGLSLEVQEIGGPFHYSNLAIPNNPAWSDNALTTIPWSEVCYTFTTAPGTTDATVWLSASAENGGPISYVVIDDVCISTCPATCTTPSAITLTQTAATCTGATSNNDGTITLTAATDGTHFGISTLNAAVYDGAAFASATAISLPQLVKTVVPNSGGTYILRVFNGADDCFTDQTVTVATVNCAAPPCLIPNCGTATIIKN